MNSNVKMLLASLLLLCLPLVTGCGKDGNPMAPEPEPEAAAESLDVTVTLASFYADVDGDGIEGPGDFEFVARVYDGAPGHTLQVTAFPHLEAGTLHWINRTRVIRVPKDQNYNIEVRLTATEWDGDIFGATWADTRMDHLWDRRLHSDANRVVNFNQGQCSITLGDDELRVRLYYTITSTPV